MALSKIVYFLQKGEFKSPVMENKDTLDSTCDLKYIFFYILEQTITLDLDLTIRLNLDLGYDLD